MIIWSNCLWINKKNNSFVEKSVSESPNRKVFFEKIVNPEYWDNVKELYPPIYKYKKILVNIGLYVSSDSPLDMPYDFEELEK